MMIFSVSVVNLAVYGNDEPLVFVEPMNSIFSTTEKTVGDTIQINCTVANVTGLASFGFHLSWDPTLLICTGIQEILFHTVTPTAFWDNIWKVNLRYNNTAGTADYCQGWQDQVQAVADGYAPANITANEYPEGKLAAAIITLRIVAVPFPGGFKECSLDLSNTIMGDLNGVPIVHTINDGYYKFTGDLPVQVYVDPSTVTTVPSEMFNVSIYVHSPTYLDLYGWQLWLEWNQSMLNYTSSTSLWPPNDNTVHVMTGQLAYGGVDHESGILLSVGGLSKVFTVTFQSISYGISQINVTNFALMGKSDTGNGWTNGTDPYSGIPEFTEYVRWPDVNQDGEIGIADAVRFSASFLRSRGHPGYDSAVDYNNDSIVDYFDAAIFFADWGKTSSDPTWPSPAHPNGLTNTIYLFNQTVQNSTIFATIEGDINFDFIVDIYDAILLSNAFNSQPNSPNWNPNADMNSDNFVDIYDAILLANHYNQHYP